MVAALVVSTVSSLSPPATASVALPRVVVLGGSGAVSDAVLAELNGCDVASVDRIFGADRYATAAEIAVDGFSEPATVFLATGLDFPDAIAAGPAAAAVGSPVLLVQRDWVPTATGEQLARIDPERVVILGGSGVISESVAVSLAATGADVIRLAGMDRFATAAAISTYSFPHGSDVAFVVYGGDFPDALAAGAAAAHLGGPVLLTSGDSLPEATRAELIRLNPTKIVIVGGAGAVSQGVANQLALLGAVSRLAGSDRYTTAAAASAFTFPEGASTIYVATGEDYPDALAGAALAGIAAGPVLLTESSRLPAAVRGEIERLTGHPCVGGQAGDGVYPVGFLGCSNSVRAVRGMADPLVLWSAGEGEHAYGGGDLETWADLNDPRWDAFQEYLDSEGIPGRLWWQLCPKHTGGPEPSAEEITQVQTIVSEIKRRAPGTQIFVSPINDYDGVTCSRIGTNGVAAAEALSELVANDADVSLGPVLSPLTAATVEVDNCHQNDAGAAIHGSELVEFFTAG